MASSTPPSAPLVRFSASFSFFELLPNSAPVYVRTEWSAGYPTGKMDPNGAGLPKAWVDALNAAVKAGKIPDLPTSTSDGGNPVYPQGFDPLGPTVCSATYKCRNKEDLWDAPDGVFASSFDDGPLPVRLDLSRPLYRVQTANSTNPTCRRVFRCTTSSRSTTRSRLTS